MRVFVGGATGFLGCKVVFRLVARGHRVIAAVRDETKALAVLGTAAELFRWENDDRGLSQVLESCDAILNLSGSPIARRWTTRVRRGLERSRVGINDRIVAALRSVDDPPTVFVSGSAVGWYGDRRDEAIDEGAPAGDGFLADLCRRWEASAMAAEALGLRVVTMRTGLVLGRDGGALGAMLPAFRLGLGGRLGDGHQAMPWIHVRDAVDLFVAALEDPRWSGPVNVTSPRPVDNRAFTRALGSSVGRATAFAVPGWALRAAMGEAADVVLTGARAVPSRATELGFSFAFEDLRDALDDLLAPPAIPMPERARDAPEVPYLVARRPDYLLECSTYVDAPIDEVFAFFERAENLGAMTPPEMSFRVLTPTPVEMGRGTEIDYRITLNRVPMRWRTEIIDWEPGRRFCDVQRRGPYASWFHEHRFEIEGEGTRMRDRVWYAVPLGPLGRLAHRLYVRRQLRRVFAYREEIMRWRFGRPESPVASEAAKNPRTSSSA